MNPTAKSIKSVKAYPSIPDPPEPVDLAIIILHPEAALKAVDDAAEMGIKGIVIVSAGFREVGEEGRRIEDAITARCREAGMRLVGPHFSG